MSRRTKTAAIAAATIFALALGLLGAVSWFVRSPLPARGGEVTEPELDAQAAIARDEIGVPHIWGDTPHDVFFAQGYAHAGDRMFEMDIARRSAHGHLTDLVGPAQGAKTADAVAEAVDFTGWADRDAAELTVPTRGALAAYAAGVNAYLSKRDLVGVDIAYPMLGTVVDVDTIRPWEPVDSLAILRWRAWLDDTSLTEQLSRAAAYGAVRDEGLVADLFGTGAAIPAGLAGVSADDARAAFAVVGAARADVLLARDVWGGPQQSPGLAVAVAANRTSSGRPFLAVAAHGGVRATRPYVQNGLYCREQSVECPYRVSGFSVSGVPGVVMGQTDQTAWGHVAYGAPATTIDVRGLTPPVDGGGADDDAEDASASDAASAREKPQGAVLATGGDDDQIQLRATWGNAKPSRTLDAYMALAASSSLSDMALATPFFGVPATGLVFADVRTIAYDQVGHISGVPTPMPAPAQGAPALVDPVQGFFAATGHDIAPDTSHPPAHGRPGLLAARAEELLDANLAGSDATRGDVHGVVTDTRDQLAPLLVPALREVQLTGNPHIDDPEFVRRAREHLAQWERDGYPTTGDVPGATYYAAVFARLVQLTFADEVPGLVHGMDAARLTTALAGLLEEPDSPWWDNRETSTVVEQRDQVLSEALFLARLDLTAALGKNPRDWSYDAVHLVVPRQYPLGMRQAASWAQHAVNPPAHSTAGSAGTLWNTPPAIDAPRGLYAQTYPTAVFIASPGAKDAQNADYGSWVDAVGVSGHRGSAWFANQGEAAAARELFAWRHGLTPNESDVVLDMAPNHK